MPVERTKDGYKVYGYGHGDCELRGLTRSELFDLRTDLLAQIYDVDFDQFGQALKKLDETIEEVCGV